VELIYKVGNYDKYYYLISASEKDDVDTYTYIVTTREEEEECQGSFGSITAEKSPLRNPAPPQSSHPIPKGLIKSH
jgi:hypothetical protein